MDQAPESVPRIAFSFRAGTFDLQAQHPLLCFRVEDGHSHAVQLDGRWQRLMRRLQGLGVVLVCAQCGPLCVAESWERPQFQRIPETDILLEMNSGAEVDRTHLHSVMAVVEDVGEQQIASLQFFDVRGFGRFKIMLTNWSDLNVFEQIIAEHGAPQDIVYAKGAKLPRLEEAPPALPSFTPTSEKVRQAWTGLSRTQPGEFFPGLGGILRQDALKVAGADYATEISMDPTLELLREAALEQLPLQVTVRNPGVSLPVHLRPARFQNQGCGQTFFGQHAQFTLRRCCGRWTAWSVQYHPGTEAPRALEIYDKEGVLAGVISLDADATGAERITWQQQLIAVRQPAV